MILFAAAYKGNAKDLRVATTALFFMRLVYFLMLATRATAVYCEKPCLPRVTSSHVLFWTSLVFNAGIMVR